MNVYKFLSLIFNYINTVSKSLFYTSVVGIGIIVALCFNLIGQKERKHRSETVYLSYEERWVVRLPYLTRIFFSFSFFLKIYFNRIILVWINNTWFNPCPIYFQFGKPIWFGNWKCKSSSLLRSQSKCLLSCWKRVLQRFIWVHGRSCHNGGCHCQHASDIVCIDAFVASF